MENPLHALGHLSAWGGTGPLKLPKGCRPGSSKMLWRHGAKCSAAKFARNLGTALTRPAGLARLLCAAFVRPLFASIVALALGVLVSASDAHATTYYSLYGQNRTTSITVVPATYTFEVDQIAIFKWTEWYVNGVWTGAAQNDYSGLFADDPDYTYTFSSGTTEIKALVYNSTFSDAPQSHVWKVTVDITAPTVPSLTSPVTGSATSDNTVSLDWSDSSDAGTGVNNYEVQVDDSSGFGSPNYSATPTISGATTSALVDGLYYWRVRAKDKAGNWSSYSSPSTFRVDTVAPSTPGTITISGVTSTSATMRWGSSSDAGGGTITYEVEYGARFSLFWTPAGTTTTSSMSLTGLAPDTTYVVRVRARDNYNPEAYSSWNELNPAFKTLANSTPTQPGVITPSRVTSDSASIAWVASTDSDGDTITYEIEYGVNNTFGWTPAGSTTSTSTALVNLESETTYVVHVRATDGKGGVSSWQELDPAFKTLPVRGIASAYWLLPNYVTEGAVVTMRAQVTSYTGGDAFNFEIREDDGLLGSDSVTNIPGQVVLRDGGQWVEATWTTVWQSDQFGGDPEFYFIVSRSGISLTSSTDDAYEMHVTQRPALSLSKSILSPLIIEGQNASDDSFDLWNSGGGNLSYSISDNGTWLSTDPASGTSTGEHDPITVKYSTTGLLAGTYTAKITVSGSGISGSPQSIDVTLVVSPPPRLLVEPTKPPLQPAHGGPLTLTVKNVGGGTLSYRATVDCGNSWLHIISGDSGGHGGVITLMCDANSGGQRSGTIAVAASGASESPALLSITQLTPNPVAGFLIFPIQDLEYNTTDISSIFDHAMVGPDKPGTSVQAYNGEIGTVRGKHVTGDPPNERYGYTNPDIPEFSLPHGNYTGGATLYYEGHTGYDFPYGQDHEVIAAAGGVLHKRNDDYNQIWIDHGNGYSTWYVHMLKGDTDKLIEGEIIKQGGHLGYCGNFYKKDGGVGYHLHFTVKSGSTPVDPYGWTGCGEDPYYNRFDVRSDFLWVEDLTFLL